MLIIVIFILLGYSVNNKYIRCTHNGSGYGIEILKKENANKDDKDIYLVERQYSTAYSVSSPGHSLQRLITKFKNWKGEYEQLIAVTYQFLLNNKVLTTPAPDLFRRPHKNSKRKAEPHIR